MRAQPCLGACYYLVELFGLRCALELGLALALLYPQNGVVRVGIYRLARYALLVEQRQGVYDGEKLAYVVSAVYGSEVEHLRSGGEVDSLILHRARIARAGCVYSPSVRRHLHRERQHGVVTVIGRVLHCHTMNIIITCAMITLMNMPSGYTEV